MKSAVVKAHRAGLFSNVNKVITCLRIYEHVHVDWSEDSLYGDCWSELFEATVKPDEPYDLICDYPFNDLTWSCAGILYQNESWGWRDRFHMLWEKLRVKNDLQIKAATQMTYMLGGETTDVVGVLVRSDGQREEQLSGRIQSYSEYGQAIIKSGCPLVYVAATDDESVSWFATRFGAMHSNDIRRNNFRAQLDFYLREPQTAEDAKKAMIEVLTLARCKALIHPISNMATTALIINPAMQSIYLK